MKRVLLILFLIGITAFAEVKTDFKAVKINSEGEKIEVTETTPGDEIIYILEIKNDYDDDIKNSRPRIPIPDEMIFDPLKTSPGYKVSLDGEKFYNYPMKDSKGKIISDKEYRFVRWEIPTIPKGGDLKFEAGAKVKRGDEE